MFGPLLKLIVGCRRVYGHKNYPGRMKSTCGKLTHMHFNLLYMSSCFFNKRTVR